ncbi:MAG: Hsp20/alpha crystallin family protein [Bdellovibrionia bacterium]
MAIRNLFPDVRRSEWSPLREMSRMQRDIDRMFDDFISPGANLTGDVLNRQMVFSPVCDVEETDSHFLVSFDLPGINKKDVNIELRDNQLIVSGERKEEHKVEKRNRMSTERFYGTFQRAFTLPSTVDADKVEAQYEDGVLRVAIPKSEAAKPKQIEIKEGKGGFFQKLLGRGEKEVKSEKAA